MLLLLLYGLLHLSMVQTWLAQKTAGYLSKELHARVTVRKVDFSFYDKLSLEGLLIEDQHRDTLLYAGAARVKITDWFFLKDKVTLHYVGLEDAQINLRRTDATWNYQFLVDYFSSPSSGKKKKKSGGIELDLKKIHFSNLSFRQIDQWLGQDMIASLKLLDADVDSLNINQQRARIRYVRLEEPYFMQSDYYGLRPDSLKPKKNNLTDTGNLKVSTEPGWAVYLQELSLKDGAVLIKQDQDDALMPGYFEGGHLFFNHIQANMQNLSLERDTLRTRLLLSTTERSGLEVKKLSSNVTFASTAMIFDSLDLQTNRSRLGPHFAMHYNNFDDDMNRFLHAVVLDAEFRQSNVHSDDIAFFAPGLTTWHRNIQLNGKAHGTIDRLLAPELEVKSGNTAFKGKISMRGLPDIDETFIDATAQELTTTYEDLSVYVPALTRIKEPKLNRLGNIRYKGSYTGFLNDFVAFGTIQTNLGTVSADINMKLPEKQVPAYSGKLVSQGFQIGQLLGDAKLGSISLNGQVAGKGFNLKELDSHFNGYVSDVAYNGYRYKDISLNGNFRKSVFTGHLQTNDPNLRIAALDGSIHFAGPELAFNLDADVQYINLKQLKFSPEDFQFKGKLNLNFTGNDIDHFLGSARIYEGSLIHDSTRLAFDSLRLESALIDGNKHLTLQSNELDASLKGKFTIADLPDAFRVFLGRYYPAYVKLPNRWVKDQNFSFNIKSKNLGAYVPLFDKRLGGLNDAEINGNLNLANYELNVQASIPELIYDDKRVTDIRFNGSGNRDTLQANMSVSDLIINDSLHFPESRIDLVAHNDVSDLKIKTSAGKTLNDAEINASVQTLSDGVKVHFYPSSFTLNDKRWTLEKDGELTLREHIVDANEIVFKHEDQQIKIFTEMDDETNHTHVVAKLQNVHIEDFSPFVVKDPALSGILSGTATIREPFGKTKFEFAGVADSFAMDKRYIGKVNLTGNANTSTGLVQFNAKSQEKEYDFDVGGQINYLDSTGNSLAIQVKGKKINLNILEPFLGSIFSKIDGTAETNLDIKEVNGKKYILGSTHVTDGSFLVAYTRCRYNVKDQQVLFDKEGINLGKLQISDTLKDAGTGTVTGRIRHDFFDNLYFDNLRLETGKLLLLNTTAADNSQFYGNVIGSARLNMEGPLSNLVMNISGKPSYVDSSHIYLQSGADKESNAVDYIEFVKFGNQMGEETTAKENTNILVNLAIAANPACKVDVILDQETGDVIKGQGEGQINIKVGSREPLSIRGRYDLTKGGEYTFNFQTFVKKGFTLNKGSISFNGDPYQAIMDIDAEYNAKNVDISSLSSSGGFRQKSDIIIISHLTGNLKEPLIDFEFKIPENNEASRNDLIVKRLADFRNDKNELNKQVVSLLLFNSFIFGDQNLFSTGNIGTFAANTIGGLISSTLTNLFNRQLEKATKGLLSTYIDINPTLDLQRNIAQLQANVRAGVKFLFNKRLQLLIGGNLDYNNSSYAQQLSRRGLLTPDISLEYLLNKDGSFRVVGFNRTSIDFSLNQLNRSGLQLSYRRDVNRLGDIFRKQKNQNSTPAPKKKGS